MTKALVIDDGSGKTPITAGGTGASTAADARTNLGLGTIATKNYAALDVAVNEAKGADIASATTTDIGAATGNYVNVTGTTTITGLGTVQAGTRRIVNFTGALTLTHNATSLILPTAANITTAAGDTAVFVSLGSGNWKCVSYDRASGAALAAAGGGWEQIGTFTSAGTTSTFETLFSSIPTSYKMLKLVGYFTRNTGDASMRLNNAGGGTDYYYSATFRDTAGGEEQEGGGTNDRISPLIKGGSGTERYIMELTFSNQASTPNGFFGHWGLRSLGSTTINNRGDIQGGLVSAAQITSISMTNITSGDYFVLLGMK